MTRLGLTDRKIADIIKDALDTQREVAQILLRERAGATDARFLDRCEEDGIWAIPDSERAAQAALEKIRSALELEAEVEAALAPLDGKQPESSAAS